MMKENPAAGAGAGTGAVPVKGKGSENVIVAFD